MLHRFRQHFGTAGLVVAIIALIAALGGGALAATGGSGSGGGKATASAKAKQGPRGKTGKTGKTGPAGPAGPQGPAGANGKDGANGSNGSNGAAGATGPTGAHGSAGSAGAVGETGPTGDTGPAGTFGGATLPEGVTETGYWTFTTPGTKAIEDGANNMVTIGSTEARAPLSFPVLIGVPTNTFSIHFAGDADFETTCGEGEGGVGGTISVPKAPAHTLCIFVDELHNATITGICGLEECIEDNFRKSGGTLKFTTTAEGPATGIGAWAVTG